MRSLAHVQRQLEPQLRDAGVGSAHLDLLILLEDLLERDRGWILAHPEQTLSNYQFNKLRKQIERRKGHEPLAYIRGFSNFYKRTFKVNRHVLEPRPESEAMIELLMTLNLGRHPGIADVGTGCGCLGITAALEVPDSQVDLYDIDSGALAVAKHNVHMHELHLQTHKRDLLNRPTRTYDVVLANLPYVPDHWKINPPAMREPSLAIFGGRDGLNLYRRLFTQIEQFKRRPSFILTESLPPQHSSLASIAGRHGFKPSGSQDFIQIFRPA